MEVPKKTQKNGGFLHLFDWNAKSRKKLFPNNSVLPKQENGIHENQTKLQSVDIILGDNITTSSNRGSTDFSCASYITSEKGHGTRPPNIVAKLMGLNSMPTSNACGPCCKHASSDSSLVRSSHDDKSYLNLWTEFQPNDYSNTLKNKTQVFPWNDHKESRPPKGPNPSIERFRTEVLPPKSAKLVSITRHQLLSPIKSPGFIPVRNEAYIIQATAKMMAASPRVMAKDNKLQSVGPSSAPLRIRDLKQKVEAAHKRERSNDTNAAKSMELQSRGKTIGENAKISFSQKSSLMSQNTTNNMNKRQPISLAVQTKAIVQRRDGTSTDQKEQNEGKPNHLSRNQSTNQKNIQKKSSENRDRKVLRPNNQKQNSISNRGSSLSKSLISDQQGKRTQSNEISNSRPVNEVVVNSETRSRKINIVATDSVKQLSPSKQNNLVQTDRSAFDSVLVKKDIKCNVEIDGCLKGDATSMKQGMDVVSFTFMSPLTKSKPNLHSPSSVSEGISNTSLVGGDALSSLLKTKFRELSCKVEASHCNLIRESGSASTIALRNSLKLAETKSSFEKDKPDKHDDFACFSIANLEVNVHQSWQPSEGREDHGSSVSNSADWIEVAYLHKSPGGSFSGDTHTASGSRHSSPSQAQEASDLPSMEGQTELSDSAASERMKYEVDETGSLTSVTFKESTDWELEYGRYILSKGEVSMDDIALGKNENLINLDILRKLDHDESEEKSKLDQKLLLDCVSECVELRRRHSYAGSSKGWMPFARFSESKKWLAEEVYKEISGWKKMQELMVDEVVDNDMSCGYGRWVDFESEAFEQGLDIEQSILISLVDEVTSELLVF